MKGKLAAGIDPVSERDAVLADAAKAAQEKRRKHTNSVEATASAFIERYAKPRLRSWREYERMLQDYVLPAWGSRPITEIRRSDVTALLDSVLRRVNSGDGTLGKLIQDDTLYTRLVGIAAGADSLLALAAHGDGLAARLLRDQGLYDKLTKSVSDLNAILADVRANPRKYTKGMIRVF